jgi:Flp pilus assembly protein CpaB
MSYWANPVPVAEQDGSLSVALRAAIHQCGKKDEAAKHRMVTEQATGGD